MKEIGKWAVKMEKEFKKGNNLNKTENFKQANNSNTKEGLLRMQGMEKV